MYILLKRLSLLLAVGSILYSNASQQSSSEARVHTCLSPACAQTCARRKQVKILLMTTGAELHEDVANLISLYVTEMDSLAIKLRYDTSGKQDLVRKCLDSLPSVDCLLDKHLLGNKRFIVLAELFAAAKAYHPKKHTQQSYALTCYQCPQKRDELATLSVGPYREVIKNAFPDLVEGEIITFKETGLYPPNGLLCIGDVLKKEEDYFECVCTRYDESSASCSSVVPVEQSLEQAWWNQKSINLEPPIPIKTEKIVQIRGVAGDESIVVTHKSKPGWYQYTTLAEIAQRLKMQHNVCAGDTLWFIQPGGTAPYKLAIPHCYTIAEDEDSRIYSQPGIVITEREDGLVGSFLDTTQILYITLERIRTRSKK